MDGIEDVLVSVEHFNNIFTQPEENNNLRFLDYLECTVTDHDNEMLQQVPTEEEIRDAIFSMDPNSLAGPDGLMAIFIRTHGISLRLTSLILLELSLLVPILQNTSLMLVRCETSPYAMVSKNQSGFIKGRLITENILLAQETVHDIRNNTEGGNVIFKLDMSKAYDNFSWYGFFNSSRGLKQGDPLSPALFIMAAKALSKSLNNLNSREDFKGFHMKNKGPQVNHLCYADDLIIFSLVQKHSIKMIMKILKKYQDESGQEINIDKSYYITHTSVNPRINKRLKKWTVYKHSSFIFNYLGCPIYTGRKTSSQT
ncbi:uncharacterized protein LOC132034835 [Lycium ferocissimum]|uniref:uncharacterized protein LOC132034835 n=1 Tax=Lycium ferocissimum TaxID=112874 RepID=UPI0028166B1F|nr:uncharacterized protein LOC132034835 [Lycium ferocissimum]